jgi:hypothetical protein
MSYILVEIPGNFELYCNDKMLAVAKDAGFQAIRETEVLCTYMAHPVDLCIGRYQGHQVEVGENLLLNIDRNYSVYISVKNCESKKLSLLNESIKERLMERGYDAFIWPSQGS